ncbi:hypothetical protein Efla_002897 [Eimeria flavescens]
MTHVRLSNGELGLLGDAVQVLPGKVYFRRAVLPPRDTAAMHFFSTDTDFVYEPFFLDFGPLNLSCIFRYCMMLNSKLQDPALRNKVLVHYTYSCSKMTTNAVLLLGSFLVVAMGKTPEEAMQPFAPLSHCLRPFRDATYSGCYFCLSVLDCLRGLSYAVQCALGTLRESVRMQLGWFDLASFDQAAYDHYEQLENGDLSWIIPGKFLAFSCPAAGSAAMSCRRRSGKEDGTPQYYVNVFKKMKVKLVIRLNKKLYDAKIFKKAGIQHHDLFFVDGTCPPREIIHKFLQLCEACDGPIAVHCKAGLGRTGSLIGCYAMKNYKFPALPWIGWNRICRPGSVLGPQQYFLSELVFYSTILTQDELMKMDAIPSCSAVLKTNSRNGTSTDAAEDELVQCFKHMGMEDKRIAEHGDEGQGDRLVEAKWRSRPTWDLKRDMPLLQTSSSFSDSSRTAEKAPQVRRASTSAVNEEPTSALRLEAMLRSKFVGHLLNPVAAAAASAGRSTAGGSCHVPSAGSPSGVYVASASRPSTNRSRNDV